jgi:hypothetical protein
LQAKLDRKQPVIYAGSEFNLLGGAEMKTPNK